MGQGNLQAIIGGLIEIIPDAVIVQDKEGKFVYANRAAENLFRVSRNEIVGKPYNNPPWKATTVDGKPIPKKDQPFMQVLKRKGPVPHIEQAIERQDGTRIFVSINAAPFGFEGGPILGVALSITDITEQKLAEQQLKDARDYAESIVETVREPLIVLDANLRVVTANRSFYDTFKVSKEETENKLIYELGNRQWDIPKLKGLLEDIIPKNNQFSDFEVTHDFPIIGHKTMLLNARRIVRENRPPLILLAIEDITERKQAKFSEALLHIDAAIHSVLEVDAIMQSVITKSTKMLGCDQAHVYLHEENYWVLRYAYGLPPEMIGRKYTDEEVPITTLAATTKNPVAVGDAYTDERVNRDLMKKYGIRAFLAAPLIMKDVVAGMLAFIYKKEPVYFDSIQLDFLARLASSVSLSIENARLYEEQRHIADTLQESLLVMPERVAGVDFGYLYRSATEIAKIGGDFYDIFELEHDRVSFVIGDISGKGIEAATSTSIVKSSIKAHALENGTPALIIAKTNDTVVKILSPGNFVTAFFGILDTTTGILTYCNAGHPPAIIKRKTGEVEVLTKHSPLIGAFPGVHYKSEKEYLDKIDILLLYTDGVTEARRDWEFFGEKRLVNFVAELRTVTAKDLPQLILNEVMSFTKGKLTDDIALLAISLKSS
ncbi:MAG: SpoIIE family protein phosphatase [Actinomycetota bacterium]